MVTQNKDMNQKTPSDEDLIRQVQKGDMEAFNSLYTRHLPLVYNRVRYRIPTTDVEDVTQEVFITVVKSLKGFKGNSSFKTWLRTLTNRRVADYYRQRKEQEVQLSEPLTDMNPGAFPGLSTEDNTESMDNQLLIRDALTALPEHYQDILLLRFAEGLKFQDIARADGRSLEATKSLFRRAMEAVRTQLGEING